MSKPDHQLICAKEVLPRVKAPWLWTTSSDVKISDAPYAIPDNGTEDYFSYKVINQTTHTFTPVSTL